MLLFSIATFMAYDKTKNKSFQENFSYEELYQILVQCWCGFSL
jgi:hypothetical protein